MKICALVGDMYLDYSSEVIKTLAKEAVKRGHTIDVFGGCSVPSQNPLHAEGLKSVLSLPPFEEYDGIILCADTLRHAGLDNELVKWINEHDYMPPVINIRDLHPDYYNVLPNNGEMMHDISKYVIGKCQSGDIGFVTGRMDNSDSRERLDGFVRAMKEAGYEVSDSLIFNGNYWMDQGPQTADFFIREDGSLPKAIICSNDYMAIALVDELINRGYEIPKDVMVTGFDNIEAARAHIPSLTTMDIPETVLTEEAISMLESVVEGTCKERNRLVKGRILLRESTADGSAERDLFASYKQLDIIKQTSLVNAWEFAPLIADFEDSLSLNKCVDTTLNKLKQMKLYDSCFLISYRENNRELVGMIDGKGQLSHPRMLFPGNKLLPDVYLDQRSPLRIYLPVSHRTEVYGYCILELNPDAERAATEKVELILMLCAQTMDKLEMYKKMLDVEDVMELYIRDPLTGAYNRRGFDKRLSELFENKKAQNGFKASVVSIDMDGLKYINDTFGHTAGDVAIKALSKCIGSSLLPDEFMARMGGDEFVVILIQTEGRNSKFLKDLRSNIRITNANLNTKFEFGASVGISDLTSYNDIMECINNADKEMYKDKKNKKTRSGKG